MVPFPIPNDQYDQTIEMLQAMDLGYSVNRDCTVDEVDSRYHVLADLHGTLVNVDQLDYLAKRLDSFCEDEDAQFQAMAHKLELADIKDLINLTFCCQQATVITDFSDLEAVGRSHFMNLNGGSAKVEELENLDGVETALLLIDGGGETVTVYNEPRCSLTLTKKDAITGKPVPNTEFILKDGDGNLIGRYTTGVDGTVTVTGLTPNSTVVVVESRVPSNYVLDPTPHVITVRNGSNSSTITGSASGGTSNGGNSSAGGTGGGGNNVVVENVPKVTLTIEKYLKTESGEKPLKGTTFLVTDQTGAVIGSSNGEFTSDENGRIVIPNLEPGTTVTAKEISVPDGVVLDSSPKSILIKAGETDLYCVPSLRGRGAKPGLRAAGLPLRNLTGRRPLCPAPPLYADAGRQRSGGTAARHRHGKPDAGDVRGAVAVRGPGQRRDGGGAEAGGKPWHPRSADQRRGNSIYGFLPHPGDGDGMILTMGSLFDGSASRITV